MREKKKKKTEKSGVGRAGHREEKWYLMIILCQMYTNLLREKLDIKEYEFVI